MVEKSELTRIDSHVHNHSFDKPYAMRTELLKSIERSEVDVLLMVDKVFTSEDNIRFMAEKYEYGKMNDPDKLEEFRKVFGEKVEDLGKKVIFGYEVRAEYSKDGDETLRVGDILIFGDEINEKVSEHVKEKNLPPSANYWLDLAQKAPDSGVIIPHPYMPLSSVGGEVLEKIVESGKCHGIEVYNAAVPAVMELVYGPNRSAYDFWKEMKINNKMPISGTCGTDNVEGRVGIAHCVTEKIIDNSSDFVRALKDGKVYPATFPFFSSGIVNSAYENIRSSVKWAATVLSGRHS